MVWQKFQQRQRSRPPVPRALCHLLPLSTLKTNLLEIAVSINIRQPARTRAAGVVSLHFTSSWEIRGDTQCAGIRQRSCLLMCDTLEAKLENVIFSCPWSPLHCGNTRSSQFACGYLGKWENEVCRPETSAVRELRCVRLACACGTFQCKAHWFVKIGSCCSWIILDKQRRSN